MKTNCDNEHVCDMPRKEKCDYWIECTSHGSCLACGHHMGGKCSNKIAWHENQKVIDED
jgi:hypothetical protein